MPKQAQRGGGNIAATRSKPRRWKGMNGQPHAPSVSPPTPGKRPGTHCTGGWVGLGAGLDGQENLAPTGILSPDRAARSCSPY